MADNAEVLRGVLRSEFLKHGANLVEDAAVDSSECRDNYRLGQGIHFIRANRAGPIELPASQI